MVKPLHNRKGSFIEIKKERQVTVSPFYSNIGGGIFSVFAWGLDAGPSRGSLEAEGPVTDYAFFFLFTTRMTATATTTSTTAATATKRINIELSTPGRMVAIAPTCTVRGWVVSA